MININRTPTAIRLDPLSEKNRQAEIAKDQINRLQTSYQDYSAAHLKAKLFSDDFKRAANDTYKVCMLLGLLALIATIAVPLATKDLRWSGLAGLSIGFVTVIPGLILLAPWIKKERLQRTARKLQDIMNQHLEPLLEQRKELFERANSATDKDHQFTELAKRTTLCRASILGKDGIDALDTYLDETARKKLSAKATYQAVIQARPKVKFYPPITKDDTIRYENLDWRSDKETSWPAYITM